MDISEIKAKNYRCHDDISLLLRSVTLVTGPNGSGKSSLLEVPATVLLGENTWTNRDQIKLKTSIRRGEKTAKVSLKGRSLLTRAISRGGSKLSVAEKSVTQHQVLENLGVTPEQLRASLIPKSFLDLKMKDQKDALYDLLSGKVSVDDLKKVMPETQTWEKVVGRWLEDHDRDESVDIDKIRQFVYDARGRYKKKLQKKEAGPGRKSQVIKLASLNEQEKALQKKIACIEFDNERFEKATEERNALREYEKELEALIPKREGYLAAKKERKELAGDLEEIDTKLEQKGGALRELQVALDEFDSFQDGRKRKVSCPVGLDCPHKTGDLKEKKEHLRGKTIALEGEIASAKNRKNEIVRSLKRVTDELQKMGDVEEKIRTLTLKIDATGVIDDRPLIDTSRMKKEAEKVKSEIDHLMKEVEGEEDPVEEPTKKDQTLLELDEIVSTLTGEVKIKIISTRIDSLEDSINRVLQDFRPWRLTFFMEGEYSPTILHLDNDEYAVQVGELSDGERSIISLVVQDAFSRRSGINLVVVDNIDLLDEASLRTFFETAKRLESKVLTAMTNLSAVAEKSGIPTTVLTSQASPKKRSEEAEGSLSGSFL